MKDKISFGVISTARIGTDKVIPAMQLGKYTKITAIASRDIAKAEKAAKKLSISKAYGSYEELIKDEEIDAVYIPLPNHLHKEWIIKSLTAGIHVLCEKPITMNYEEAKSLEKEIKKFPDLKVMEAFMYRFHPQWLKVKELIKNNEIGEVKSIHSVFSYFNDNPDDIRNKSETGGGGLLDIGCYCISVSRFIFNDEPSAVSGSIKYDEKLGTDILASALLEFKNGYAAFTCSTQMTDQKVVNIMGTKGKIEFENPFTPEPDKPFKIFLTKNGKKSEINFDACNQYTLQGDQFAFSILNNLPQPTPFEDAINNMKVIDAVFRSGTEVRKITLEK